jgi:hypothetical protein
MIRTFVLFSLVILFGSIIIVLAFTEGWIKIVVTPNGNGQRIERIEPENYWDQPKEKSIDEYFLRNPSFDLIKHTIEPGETLIDLEKKYGTSWKVIQRLNNIEDPLRVQPGKIIHVPIRTVNS